MEYRRLGATGLELSAIALGSWATAGEQLEDRESCNLLSTAYDLGINFFDNAETYANGESEEAIGRALQRLRWPRETYVISSKVYWGVHQKRPNTWGLSRKHVIEGCHASLRRLGLEHLDLYFCHRADMNTPLLETVRAMSDLVSQGHVLYWGTSEWPESRVRAALRLADDHGLVPPMVEQLQYNMLARDRVETEYVDLLRREKYGLTTWSPLAYGLLSGRYDDGFGGHGRLGRPEYQWLLHSLSGADPTEVLARVRRVNDTARGFGWTPSQLALAWVLRNPAVTSAISGASLPTHLHENLGALKVVAELHHDVLMEIDAALGDSERRMNSREGGTS